MDTPRLTELADWKKSIEYALCDQSQPNLFFGVNELNLFHERITYKKGLTVFIINNPFLESAIMVSRFIREIAIREKMEIVDVTEAELLAMGGVML